MLHPENGHAIAEQLRRHVMVVEKKGGKHLILPIADAITIANLLDTLAATAKPDG